MSVEGSGFAERNVGLLPKLPPFFNPGYAEETEQASELFDGIGPLRHPAKPAKGLEGESSKPFDALLQCLSLSAPGEKCLVVALAIVPKSGRNSGHTLQLDGCVGSDGRFSLDNFIDRLEWAARPLGEFFLAHPQ